LRLLDDVESDLGGLAGDLGPAGQQVVDPRRGEIGLDAEAAVAVAAGDPAAQLDRDGAADARS